MTENDDKTRTRQSSILSRIRQFGWAKLVVATTVVATTVGTFLIVLELPGQFNDFLEEFPLTREYWLKAHQWTGMYSSFPEGVVNMEDLDLSSESDVVLNLNYSEERHRIDGYIYSEAFLGRYRYLETSLGIGLFYPDLMLDGEPSILRPNSLRLDVFDVVEGHLVFIDTLRIKRDVPDDLITVSSTGPLLHHALRLSPDEHLTEDELDFRSLLERARDNTQPCCAMPAGR